MLSQLLESIAPVPWKAEVEIYDAVKRPKGVVYKGVVKEGVVYRGDIFRVGRETVSIDNIYVNNQEVPLAVEGEEVELYSYSLQVKNAIQRNKTITIVNEQVLDLVSVIGLKILRDSGRISPNQYYELLECNRTRARLRRKVHKLVEQGLINKVLTSGLRALFSGGKLVKGLSLATALSVFAYGLYNKLNRACIGKVGLDKLRCQKMVADRIVAELTRQQAVCNSLTDPVRRRHCLAKVEGEKKKWTQKSAELAVKIAQMER